MCQHLDGGRAPDANQMPDVPDVIKSPVFFTLQSNSQWGRGGSTLQTFQICTLTSPLPLLSPVVFCCLLLPTVVYCCLLLPTVVQCAHFFYPLPPALSTCNLLAGSSSSGLNCFEEGPSERVFPYYFAAAAWVYYFFPENVRRLNVSKSGHRWVCPPFYG